MLIKKHKVSERRACRVVGQNRSSNRYVATPSDFEEKLVARMVKLAGQHPKWGYRMIHALLVDEGEQLGVVVGRPGHGYPSRSMSAIWARRASWRPPS